MLKNLATKSFRTVVPALVAFACVANAQIASWKVNFGPRRFQQDGWTALGPQACCNIDTAQQDSIQFGTNEPTIAINARGSRDYGPVVSGPWMNMSNVLRTFLYGDGVVTISNLVPRNNYIVTLYGHDTSTNRQHPHHVGLGVDFVITGATMMQRRVVFSDRGDSPPLNDLTKITINMRANPQGRITISFDRLINGLEIWHGESDAPTPAPTTTTPTPPPTGWWEHSNFSVLDERIQALEQLLNTMPQVVNNISSLDSRLATVEALQAQVAQLNATVVQQSVTLNTVRAAMLDAVDALSARSPQPQPPGTSCTGSSCVPSVTAEGRDISMRAPGGAVSIESGTCGTIDICEDRTFTNQTLQRILSAFDSFALV